MIDTSSIFGLILTSLAHLRKRLVKSCGGLGGENLRWGGVKCASLCTACTDRVYSEELERDVTTRAMA